MLPVFLLDLEVALQARQPFLERSGTWRALTVVRCRTPTRKALLGQPEVWARLDCT